MNSQPAPTLKPYPSYKQTGIPWLTSVPNHWSLQRLKKLVRIKTGGRDTIHKREDGNYPFFIRSQTVERIDTWSHDGKAVLTAGDGAVGEIFHYVNGKFDYHQRVYMFHDFTDIEGKFFFHYFKATLRHETSQGTAKSTVDSLRLPMLQNFPVVVPPSSEQAAIVRYLDHADDLINRYISAKERLIALLDEQRQAVIHEAVTRGLDTNTAFEPSTVPELGDVPAHWQIFQLGRLGNFSKGSGGTKDDEITEGLPCVRYGDIYTFHKCFVRQTRSFIARHRAHDYAPMKYGDVLFTGSGETIEDIGKSVVNLIDGEAYCGGDVILFRPRAKTHPEFLGYLLDSARAIHQKASMGRGITIMHIYSSQLKYLWLALPPFAEQVQIAAHIGKVTKEVDQAINGTQHQVNLMNEYRTRLIADVVTGQTDVRNATVELPN